MIIREAVVPYQFLSHSSVTTAAAKVTEAEGRCGARRSKTKISLTSRAQGPTIADEEPIATKVIPTSSTPAPPRQARRRRDMCAASPLSCHSVKTRTTPPAPKADREPETHNPYHDATSTSAASAM